MSAYMYDLCVVGAGMIGSSAARHASRDPAVRVCLIGPPEPQTRTMEDKRDIFGSHYDEGRITSSSDPDPVVAILTQESIKRYREIEEQSGVTFYTELGCLVAGSAHTDYMTNVKNSAKEQGAPLTHLNHSKLAEKFPYLKMASDDVGTLEIQNAGHISPRNLVKAQKMLCEKQGCRVIDDVVCVVKRIVQQDGRYVMRVITEGGREILSKTVLLATGAFTNFRELLPGIKPEQRLCGLTVALVEVDKEYARKLKAMPPVVYRGSGHPDLNKFPRFSDSTVGFYMLPPIRYPDGRDYIKLGHFHAAIPEGLTTGVDIKEWFVKGNKRLAEQTAKFIASLFRGLELKSWHGDYCVITETPTHRPYIDKVHAQLGVAIGGNGRSAQSCDEIGRLAANMMFGRWDSRIPRDVFKLKLDDGRGTTVKISKL